MRTRLINYAIYILNFNNEMLLYVRPTIFGIRNFGR